jgi:hypothetical protein
MKNFKPLAIAAAVSTAAAGYAGVVNAQVETSAANTGSLAIVPYYTVQEGYITGINIVNTTDVTQIVKVRFRRGSDSMDALDFNVIMSPEDIFNGYISGDDENSIAFRTNDNSCTAPILPFEEGSDVTRIANMPSQETLPGSITFEDGAMEGYIEIIGMAQADDDQYISMGALHDTGESSETIDNDGMPANCDTVADNFFRNARLATADDVSNGDAGAIGDVITVPTSRGVISSTVTHQRLNTDKKAYQTGVSKVYANAYEKTDPNALSVSYFIRDTDSGLEFGGRAVHLSNFSQEPMLSNQSRLISGVFDPWGFYFPDLDGGSPEDTTMRGLYDQVDGVRTALGVEAILNNWGVGSVSRKIDSDWVVTLPGQYLMVDLAQFVESTQDEDEICPVKDTKVGATTVPQCDYRDIPVQMSVTYFDREEDKVEIIPDEDELVLSPASATPPPEEVLLLPNEVNIIRWYGAEGEDTGALNSEYGADFPVSGSANNGWARLSVTADVEDATVPNPAVPSVCAIPYEDAASCVQVVNEAVPMVGFTAWKRSFDEAVSNYGRIVDHSWVTSATTTAP